MVGHEAARRRETAAGAVRQIIRLRRLPVPGGGSGQPKNRAQGNKLPGARSIAVFLPV